jgi:hypothetical protein
VPAQNMPGDITLSGGKGLHLGMILAATGGKGR